MSDEAPRVLAGKYRLISRLGEGAMGCVYRAEHLTLHSPVAVKLLNAALMQNEEGVHRFMREARAAAALRSPHVVQVLDFGVEGEAPYIVMELLQGESLAARLSQVGRLTPQETSRVLVHVGRAVARAHESGIVHRDLKPDNIFLVENDDEQIAKVLDFGIAKVSAAQTGGVQHTRTGAFIGTPEYMSPEQTRGDKALDHRTDIWAMGVIAYECLLGQRPFADEAIGALVLAICERPLPVPSQVGLVPAGFDHWFAQACARDPDARFGSAREAAIELKQLCEVARLSSGTVDATFMTSDEPRSLSITRSRATLVGAATIVSLLASAGAWFAVSDGLNTRSPLPTAAAGASARASAVTVIRSAAPSVASVAPVVVPEEPAFVPSSVASSRRRAPNANNPRRPAAATASTLPPQSLPDLGLW